MTGIIVVFPNRDNAIHIRNLLVKNGMDVVGVCTSGAHALKIAGTLDSGIVVCGYKLKDMMYSDLHEYLPDGIQMLLVASQDKWLSGQAEGIVGVSMPLKAYDLVNTVNMMQQAGEKERRRRRQKKKTERSSEEQAAIDEAKRLLMERNNMTESQAHKYLQKSSMDNGTNIVETAQMVLSVMSE